MASDAPIVDMWSGLDHMVGMGETAGDLDYAPPYVVDEHDRRRLNAYARIRAIIETVRRIYLPEDGDIAPEEFREFGDAAIYVQRVAAGVLGDGAYFAVDGADTPTRERPDIGPFPARPAEGLEPEEAAARQREYEIRVARWVSQTEAELDRWEDELAAEPSLGARQDWLDQWAGDERVMARIKQLEKEHVVALGSGIIELHWDDAHNRVALEVHSPEAYFPVLDDSGSSFPKKVHLAWTMTRRDEQGEEAEFVRRITYELVPVEGDDADPALVGARPSYLDPDDTWQWSCVYSNGVWPLDAFESMDDLASGVDWEQVPDPAGGDLLVDADQIPLNLDFMPVVLVTNNDNDAEHFGRPLIVRVVQLLDELAGTDRDEALASRRAADPPVAVSGLNPGQTSIDLRPGKGIALGEHGTMSAVDMASGMVAVGERIKSLLRRLSVNLSVPEGLVGRVDASDVPSGIAFTLSFTAFEQLIEDMRTARDHKYSLLLKMVQRIAIQNQDESLVDPEIVYPARIKFGSFMPQDLLGIAQIIKLLVDAKMISQETGIAWLREAGVPSDDLAAELVSIRGSFMTSEADAIAEALGDSLYAAQFLGIEGYGQDAGGQQAAEGIDAGGPLPAQGAAPLVP